MLLLAPDPPAQDPVLQPASTVIPHISPVFTPTVQYWAASIQRWAVQAGVDPNLLATVIQIESCGNPYARSNAGALGLFQVMPYHFFPDDDPYSPDINASRGIAYLKRSLAAAHNDVRLALAGYNGGLGRISEIEWLWPAETTRYAYWGSGIYQDASSGSATSSRLEEWLADGGVGLCSRAGQILQS